MKLYEVALVKCLRCKKHVPYDKIEGTLCPQCIQALEFKNFHKETTKSYNKKYASKTR